MGHKGPVLRPRCIGAGRAWTQLLFYSILSLYGSVSQFVVMPISKFSLLDLTCGPKVTMVQKAFPPATLPNEIPKML